MEDAASYPVAEKAPTPRYLLDRESFLGPLFLAPSVIYIIALVAIPFFLAIAFSLSDVTVGDRTLDYVGLENFRIVLNSPTFRAALKQTFIFTIISQVLVLVLAKILALLLEHDFRGKWLARFLIILPWATPISLGTIGWLWLLDSKFSPIDWVLRYFGLLGQAGALLGPENNLYYLGKTDLAMASVILVHVWRMLPLATVILLAGLTSIPQDIKEQAAVDGASFWRQLFQITIPLMLPIMSIALLFGVVFTFTDMTVVYVLTRGGPNYDTQVLATWAYYKGIEGGSLAQGAAIALFLFPVLLAAAILMLRTASRAEVA
jgi:multiple sugar transport system permease protein